MVIDRPQHAGVMATQQGFLQVSIDSHHLLVPDEPNFPKNKKKKPRLHWSPELHDRFVKAVDELGGADKATPKAIQVVMGMDGLSLFHIKSHLQKFRLGKPIGRLWMKPNRPARINLEIQLSDGPAGSSKPPAASDVFIEGEGEGEGSVSEIRYENNQMQVKPEEPVENDEGGQHHSMVAPENACDTPAELKTHDEVPVALAALQPTYAARDEIGDHQTQVPTTEAAKELVHVDEEETDALPPIPHSSLEDYLKAFGQSTNFLMENFPGYEGDATVVGNPWNFGATYLDWERNEKSTIAYSVEETHPFP